MSIFDNISMGGLNRYPGNGSQYDNHFESIYDKAAKAANQKDIEPMEALIAQQQEDSFKNLVVRETTMIRSRGELTREIIRNMR